MNYQLLITVTGGRLGEFASVVAEFETSFLADAAAAKINAVKGTGFTYTVVKLY